jgi:AcrR family transcriptional regulator
MKEAGFTQGAFYGYYPDKAALFDALVVPAADGLMNQFKAA